MLKKVFGMSFFILMLSACSSEKERSPPFDVQIGVPMAFVVDEKADYAVYAEFEYPSGGHFELERLEKRIAIAAEKGVVYKFSFRGAGVDEGKILIEKELNPYAAKTTSGGFGLLGKELIAAKLPPGRYVCEVLLVSGSQVDVPLVLKVFRAYRGK